MLENNQAKKVSIDPETMQEKTLASELDASTIPKLEEPTLEADPRDANTLTQPNLHDLKGNKLLTVLLAFVAGFLIFTSGVLMGLAISDAFDHGGQGISDEYMPVEQGHVDDGNMGPQVNTEHPQEPNQDGTMTPPLQQGEQLEVVPYTEVTN